MKNLLFYIFLLTIPASCSGPSEFEFTEKMPDNNWNRFKPVLIEYQAPEDDLKYDILIVARYNKNFMPLRLNVMGTMYTPSGEERYREYFLKMNDSNGMPEGILMNDENGEYYESVVLMYNNHIFAEQGTYKFEVENLMSKYDNPGIISIGIRIVPSE